VDQHECGAWYAVDGRGGAEACGQPAIVEIRAGEAGEDQVGIRLAEGGKPKSRPVIIDRVGSRASMDECVR
jgi:hypothetical protein